jgi:hypothetical protein
VSQTFELPEPAEVDGLHSSNDLLDHIEPLSDEEISSESYRENCRRLGEFVRKMLVEFGRDKQIAQKSRFIALCRLCGVAGYCGQSLRKLAAEHGLTAAAISAEVIELSDKLGFPHWQMDDLRRKSDEARAKYRAFRLGKNWPGRALKQN